VTRPQELAAIDDFIARPGVTWYEPRYACETAAHVSVWDAAMRLRDLDTTAPAYNMLLHRLAVLWRARL
jgi:hypothetical protein